MRLNTKLYKIHNISNIKNKYKVWFFAGGETRDDKFNIFTGTFIRLMKQIFEDDFEYIKGIYFKSPMMNVIWALNNAQKPIIDPQNKNIIASAFRQIIEGGLNPDTQLIIASSSSGSIIAAQTACLLAEKNINNFYFSKPFHLALGASMISTESDLFKQLIHHQREGTIGSIIHDEIQDAGDNSTGVGGTTKLEAYSNAFGLMLPLFSRKFKGPSFLNSHPKKGHVHRKRSKTVQKALDYIHVVLIKKKLAGNYYMEKANQIVIKEKNNLN